MNDRQIRNPKTEIRNRFRYSNFAEVFGELRDVYRVRRSLSENFLSPAVLLFLLVFGVITYVASRDPLAIPCCIGLPGLLFGLVIWYLFTTRRDELRIYENGFTYQSGRKLQSCLWSEIEACVPRDRNYRDINEPAGDARHLSSIKKKNGEQIDFDPDLPGTPEIPACKEFFDANVQSREGLN